jgi:hypothetical protein
VLPVAAGRGVTHREISWRAAVLRRALPALVPPRWLDPVLVLLVVGYLLGGIAATPYTLEEAVQGSLATDAGPLVTHPLTLLPGSQAAVTQESVRLAYGSLTRYASAVGWYAAGGRAAQAPIDLTHPGPSPIKQPEPDLILAARAGPALLSVIGVLVLFVLVRRMFGRAAALLAILIFGLHPTIALVTRQAADAGLTMTLGLATILVAAGISSTLAGLSSTAAGASGAAASGSSSGAAAFGTVSGAVASGASGAVAREIEPRLSAWTGLALLAGLTLASGPTAAPYLAGAISFVLAGLIGRQLHRRQEILAGRPRPEPSGAAGPGGWLAVTALGAILVWVLVSPSLWGWLPERLDTRHQERPALIAQHLVPDPGVDHPLIRTGLDVVLDPFLAPTHPVQGTGLAEYRQSWWSGLPLGERGAAAAGPLIRVLPGPVTGVLSTLLGMLLTLAAGVGLVGLWRNSRRLALAVFGWALATFGWWLLWPSDQADAATPLIVLACVLASAAAPFVLSYLARLSRESKEAMDSRGSPDSLDFLGTKDPGAHRA